MLDGKRDGWKEGTKIGRRRTDGGEEWERDGEGRGFGKEFIFFIFLIDLPSSPRPPSHVIIGRIFDRLSLWKRRRRVSFHHFIHVSAWR